MVEDTQTKLEILKSLLSNTINNPAVIQSIQEEIDKLEEGESTEDSEEGLDDLGGDFGGGDFDAGDIGGGSEPLDLSGDLDLGGGEEFGGSEESPDLDSGSEGSTEAPEEQFFSNKGGELLQEQNLPSFSELGISYTDIK